MVRDDQRPLGPLQRGASLLVLLVASVPVAAQLAVSPIIVETKAYPGGVRTFRIGISNNGKQALACTMSVMAMRVEAGGLPVPVRDAPRSCRNWITIHPQKFMLPPKAGKRLVCQVRVPKKAAGGYYAIISCHGRPQVSGRLPNQPRRGVGVMIRLTHRALVPVLLTVPAGKVQAVIEAARPIITAEPGGRGLRLALPVRNRGNIHTRMSGTVRIRSEAGQLIQRFELSAGRGFILPMHERLFRSRLRVGLPDGVYLAEIQLACKDGPPMRNVFPFYISKGRPSLAKLTDKLKAKLLKESAGFTVSPALRLVVVPAGGRRMQAIELTNLTRRPLKLRASVGEWYRTPAGLDIVPTGPPPHGRSGRQYVTLREATFELRPMSRQRVPVIVALPKGAVGECYAAVSFDRLDVQLDASPAGKARRSTMLRIWAQGTGAESAKLTDVKVLRKPDGLVRFAATLKNTGDLSVTPEASVTLALSDGGSLGDYKPASQPPPLQAGGQTVVVVEWPKLLEPGDYTAQLAVRYSKNKPRLFGRIRFTIRAQGQPTTRPTTTRSVLATAAKEARP